MRPEFYKLIGIVYVGSEDWETAVNFFEKYRRESPDLLDPLLCLYKARRRAGDDESATAVLESITEKFPENLEAQVELLKRVQEGGDFHRLRAALEKALGAHPDNLSLSNMAVHLCLGARHYAYAMIFAGRALSRAGDFDRQSLAALAEMEALR
jgi:Tfp pilus assembly protein PilF